MLIPGAHEYEFHLIVSYQARSIGAVRRVTCGFYGLVGFYLLLVPEQLIPIWDYRVLALACPLLGGEEK